MFYYLYGQNYKAADSYQAIGDAVINSTAKAWYWSKGRRMSIAASVIPTVYAIILTIVLFIS
jgi:hypothetical protein